MINVTKTELCIQHQLNSLTETTNELHISRFAGVKQGVMGEGTHFMIPWVQTPIIFDIRSRPKNVPTMTGSKDLQTVNITLRVLFRPEPDQLPSENEVLVNCIRLTKTSKN